MPVGFGIVGCGMISNFHKKAIDDIRGAKLVACYDQYQPSADKFAAANNCRAYEKLGDMLADPQLQIVTICSPSGAHMEPAVAAANAGRHVIVEKPLEVNLKRCDKIIEACENNQVKLATIFPSRFHQSAQLMKAAVDKKRFGRMTIGDAFVKWYRTQAYYDSGAWRGTWKLDGGGALMNQAVHSVDLLLWLMGPVSEVSAYTSTIAHQRIEVEDVATATIKFESGALGVIEATTASFPGSLKKIELHGSAGSAIMEEEDIIKWEFEKPTARDRELLKKMANQTKTGGGAADPAAIGHHGHTELFKDALDAIKKDRAPLIDGAEGRKSVELILAIYKSAISGRSVKLPLQTDPYNYIVKNSPGEKRNN